MTATLVEYLIARDGVPPPSGVAYDYLLGGDGLYVAARNRCLEARVPVAAATVRGLPPVYPSLALKTGRLAPAMWNRIVVEARAWGRERREVLLVVTHDDAAGYHLLRPRQIVGATRVLYRPMTNVLMEVHSHHSGPACFSPTDDADEQRLCLYGVLGRLDSEGPEVALRIGAYGHFMSVPWEAAFEGERGDFRDVNFDCLQPVMQGDVLPD